ncbi:glycosyltransferase [Pantoea sp.]|uniref:glycosyltransferase n=1 Tax=Pantoea sp. TaxID=69393 RepID=UPI0028A6EB49|nr:glycosyltransferase [Pantoea sp.]
MKNNIDISVIIPAFKAADSIGILVHTLLGETTLSTEIIVVNDGSTDETWTVLSAISDERLILIRQENQGVYAARNAALAIHRGEWVVFLEADDRIAANFLQEWLRTASEAQADVVLFNAQHTDRAEHLRHPVHRRQPYGHTLTGQQWVRHCVSKREWPHYLWLQIIRSAYIREHDLRFQEGKSHKDIFWTKSLLPHTADFISLTERIFCG